MKKVTMIVEIDLGLMQDDYEVTQKKCEATIDVCDVIDIPYTTLEITARDIDTNIVTDYIIPKVEAE